MNNIEIIKLDRLTGVPIDNGSMPYTIDPQVLALGCNELTDGAKETFRAMAAFDYILKKYSHETGKTSFSRKGYCDLSIEHLAKYRNKTMNTIRNHLIELENFGLITRKSIGTDGSINKSTRKFFDYSVLYKAQEEVDKISSEIGIKKRLDHNCTQEEENFGGKSQENLGDNLTPNEFEFRENIDTKQFGVNNTNILTIKKNTTWDESQELKRAGTIPSFENTPSTNKPSPANLADSGSDFMMTEDFILATIKGPEPKSKQKNKDKLMEKIKYGDYEKLSVTDMVQYFITRYRETYNMDYTTGKDLYKQKGILTNGFMNKYPKEECINIIDNMIDLYEKAGLANQDYRRPTLISLTQPWLINKLYDYLADQNKIKENQAKREIQADTKEEEAIPGSFSGCNIKDFYSLPIVKYGLDFPPLYKYGYIPDNLAEILNGPGAKEFSQEVINTWNNNNPNYQI